MHNELMGSNLRGIQMTRAAQKKAGIREIQSDDGCVRMTTSVQLAYEYNR